MSQRGKDDIFDLDEVRASGSSRVVLWVCLFLAAFLAWAWWFEVAEVSTGTGKVIPTSGEQVIQTLEGGILARLEVTGGDIVEKGEVLARLDPTRGESSVEETAAQYRAALASAVRLQTEIDGSALEFPEELAAHPDLIASETALFRSRRASLGESLGGLQRSLELVRRELQITRSLVETGAASNVELLRLQRQGSELELKIAEVRAEYRVRTQEELAQANAEVESLSSVMRGRADTLTRTTLRSPVRGVVKDVEVTTIGGVIPPNGAVMTIVPLDDQLLVEARISPRDIAFIHPGQDALVKVTAYDYAIYGGLPGKVVTISPDTIRDEIKPEILYYRVFVRTEADSLTNKAGARFPIVPGMVTTADIRTGSKTIWQYLIKPMNRAGEIGRA